MRVVSRDKSSCLARGVQVETPRGPVAVELLRPGDAVLTVAADQSVTAATVLELESTMRECVTLAVERRRRLRCTPDHPVYDPARGKLRPSGDWLSGHASKVWVLTDGELDPRAVDTVSEYVGVFEVFDLAFEDPRTMFVAEGIVVGGRV